MNTCQGLVLRSFTPREILRFSGSKEMTYKISLSIRALLAPTPAPADEESVEA